MNIQEFQTDILQIYFTPTSEKGVLTIDAKNKEVNPVEWIEINRQKLENILLQYGGILLRNFNISSVSEFSRFSKAFSPDLLDYTFRSTPRRLLGSKIYTTTEYPADRSIPMHNENSYCHSWPGKILFFCVIPATVEGGETPIADSRRVFSALDPAVVKKFEEKKVSYVRNFTPGIDLSWQEVFQTENRSEVEKYCHENGIQFQWKESRTALRIEQVCQATLIHPVTKEKVWFNQANLFHISSLDEQTRDLLIQELGQENLPRNAFYGDGSEIEEEALNHIRDVYEKENIVFSWQAGDILILDNVLFAHGRRPYKGERKIAVSMC